MSQFDIWLDSNGPVALSIVEPLEPVFGEKSVFFPPTFAPPQDTEEKPNYIIDDNRVCLVDSVGSQANRLEPIFKRHDLADLTPRFSVKVGNREADILDAGHRAADAVVRFSDQWERLRDAFLQYRDHHNAQPLAKIAPTSVVFGVWDSRDTQARLPRLVESTVRAYGVERVSRSAQYFSVLEKEEVEQMGLDALGQKILSEHGISDSPAGRTCGGVVAQDGIRREALLNLTALRSLGAENADTTRKLQKYILGLALIAFLAPAELYLRQGCLLVASTSQPATKQIVWRTGKRDVFDVSEQEVLSFARSAAKAFGVGPDIQGKFDPALVKAAAKKKAKSKVAEA